MTHLDAVKAVYFWQYTNGDNFNNVLLDLITKADWQNFRRLQKGFPEIAKAYQEWRDSPDPDVFFARYGITLPGAKLERRGPIDHMCPRLKVPANDS